MYNFFTQSAMINDRFEIVGADFNHIKNVLRLKIGDKIIISNNGTSNLCKIESFSDSSVIAVIEQENYNDTSLPISVTLFQGLPKSDKMELIIQKAVELGAYQIIPVATKRAIVKLDAKKEASKLKRWQAIAESAAKQSGRAIVPEVMPVVNFTQALKQAEALDVRLIPYECADEILGGEQVTAMDKTRQLLAAIQRGQSVAIFIGPEGGLEKQEVESAMAGGVQPITLGKRILRTETAGLCILSVLMFQLEE